MIINAADDDGNDDNDDEDGNNDNNDDEYKDDNNDGKAYCALIRSHDNIVENIREILTPVCPGP